MAGPEASGLVEHADKNSFPKFLEKHKFVLLMMHSSGYEAAQKSYESLRIASYEIAEYSGY